MEYNNTDMLISFMLVMGWDDFFIIVILMLISYAIQVSNIPDPTDASEGKLDVPTAEEGSSVPVVFGEVIVKTPNIIWTGDASTTPIMSEGGGKK